MKNLKSYRGTIIGLVFALSFLVWCVTSPGSTSGQASRGTAPPRADVTQAPSIQQLIAENGTPLNCSSAFTFEGGAQGFTVEPVAGTPLWHVTSNLCGAQLSGHSPTSTFYYGRDSDCTYVEGARSASNLISPLILIPTDLRPVVVSFNYLLQVEGGSFDATNVDISIDNGATWTNFLTKSNLINNGTWQNISAFVPDSILGTANSIRLRFRFDTIDSIANSTIGWHVDDIQVCSQAVDFCVKDDANGNIFIFNQTSGDYFFRSCRKGVTLSGKGFVSTSFCKVELFDSGPDPKVADRNVSFLVNPCTKKGNGSVSIFSLGQTFSVNDSNITNNICGCP